MPARPRSSSAPPPPSVRVFTLGRFVVEIDGVPLAFDHSAPRKPLDLLKVLIALGGQSVSAEQVTEALWPDAQGDGAANSLRTTLSRLRKLIGPDAVSGVHGRYSLNPAVCWADALAFARDLRTHATTRAAVSGAPEHQPVEAALSLYGGPFLAGEFGLPPVLSARARLHSLYLRQLAELGAGYERAGQVARAMDLYRRGLEIDDVSEDLYRRLMHCCQAAGRFGDGIAAYERCRETLQAQAGSTPAAETVALYRTLVAAQAASDSAAAVPSAPPQAIEGTPPAERTIAVLPFDDMSGQAAPGGVRFADAISENIIFLLAKVPQLSVAAKNSSFTYQGRAVNVQQVGRELGVGHVLEGSVLIAANHVRVTAQLIDASTGRHIWAEVYDRELGDLFQVQDEIALEVVKALQIKLTEGERNYLLRKSPSVKAWESTMLANFHLDRRTKVDTQRARMLLRQALHLEPTRQGHQVMVAVTHLLDRRFRWSSDPAWSLMEAERLVRAALDTDPELGIANRVMGDIYQYRGEFDEAVKQVNRGVTPRSNVDGNSAFVLYGAGLVAEGLALIETSLLAHPNPTPVMVRYHALGLYLSAAFSKAAAVFTRIVDDGADPSVSTDAAVSQVFLVASLSAAGQLDEACRRAQDVLAADPAFSAHDWSHWYFGIFKDKQLAPAMTQRLLAAGLPK